MGKRVLIGSLSMNPQSEPTYCLNGLQATASHCPIALVKLLPEERLPDEIVLLCTPDLSRERFPLARQVLHEELSRRIPERAKKFSYIEEMPIPEGRDTEELWEILHKILKRVSPSSILTLDITHGFRTYPFLYFSAAIFLKALRNVQIDAVYYGLLEGREAVKPIVDVSLILDMVEWFYATRAFRETGQASRLAALLEPFAKVPRGLEGEACRPYSQVKGIKRQLELFSAAYARALPLEMGWEAKELIPRLQGFDISFLENRIPLARELWDQIRSFVDPFVLDYSGKGFQKSEIPLNEKELLRQAAIIDSYLNQGYVTYAVGLMREWMVSVMIFHNCGSGRSLAGKYWASNEGAGMRSQMERVLGSLVQQSRLRGDLANREKQAVESENPELASVIRQAKQKLEEAWSVDGSDWLVSKWTRVSRWRNQVFHHGFRLENVFIIDEEIKKIWSELKESLSDASRWRVSESARTGVMLVSPLGLSRGLLFSALTGLGVAPSKLWVVTSNQASAALPEITEKAEWQGVFELYVMKAPHFGFDEAESLYYRLLPDALDAERVIVNITGGTTAIQHVIKEAASRLENIGCRVELVAFIDRRPVSEQQTDPYQLGEVVWLSEQRTGGRQTV